MSASADRELEVARARQLHKVIARQLERIPELVEQARAIIPARCPNPELARRWREILDSPIEEIRSAITAETREADELRTLSPLLAASANAGLVELGTSAASPARTKAESKLAQVRLSAGLTQEEMAERTSIPPSTYWRLERGRIANPPVGYIVACARALRVPIEDLIEDEWIPAATKPGKHSR